VAMLLTELERQPRRQPVSGSVPAG